MRFPAVLSLVLTACEAAPPPVSSAISPIIQGAFDEGDPGVAAILEDNGTVVCTGTLVAPRALVSAGHCSVLGAPRYVFFGPDPRGEGMYVNVLSTIVHPSFDLATLDADLGLVVLDQDAPTFAGVPLGVASAAPTIGAEVRVVGYGFTEIGPAGEYGRKHELVTAVEELADRSFRYGIATCNGDSGGPALLGVDGTEVIAGVTSYGDPACGEYGVDTRLDAFRDWIYQSIAEIGGPSCEADDGCLPSCAPRDPDCPITPAGEGCQSDFDCGDPVGLCLDHVCRNRCDGGGGGAEACGADETCEPVESLVTAGLAACQPKPDGCACRVGRAGGGVPWLALGALLLLFRRRRYDGRVRLILAILLLGAAPPARAQADLAAVKKEEGDARLREGKSDEARAAYERAMEIDAGYLPAYDAAVPLWFAAADWASAVKHLRAAVLRKPKYAMGWYNLAFAYRKTAAYPEAIEAYLAFVKLRPSEPDPYFGLGMTYKAMGEGSKAREAFGTYVKLEKRPEKQKFVAQARAELEGKGSPAPSKPAGDADSHNERGTALFKAGKTAEAIVEFNEAVKLDPKHKVAWYNLAHARRKAGQHAEAVGAYRSYIALDPDNPDPYYGLANSLRASGDKAGARQAFARYVALEKRPSEEKWVSRARTALEELDKELASQPAPPQPASRPALAEPASQPASRPVRTVTDEQKRDARALVDKGNTLFEARKVEAASTAYRQATELDHTNAEARYRLGVALAALGDVKGARDAFERTLLLSPKDERARRRLELARAREARTARPAPPDRQAVLDRARVLVADGRASTALLILKVLDAARDPEVLGVRAQARLQSGDVTGAIADWSVVMALDPRRPEAWRGLGAAYLAAGDKARARWFYEGFLSRAGSDPAAPAVRKRLSSGEL